MIIIILTYRLFNFIIIIVYSKAGITMHRQDCWPLPLVSEDAELWNVMRGSEPAGKSRVQMRSDATDAERGKKLKTIGR
jgi:hypothetical protein